MSSAVAFQPSGPRNTNTHLPQNPRVNKDLLSGFGVTVSEGGGDGMDGETRLSRTSAAVAETETRQSRAPRILSELTPGTNMDLDV